MKTITEIKQSIKSIAEGIEGIGKIYDRFVYAFDEKQLKDLFVSDGKINTLMFRTTQREAEGSESSESEFFVQRTWKFRLVYGYNFLGESEKEFDNLCEEICKIFNENYSLNHSVRKHSLLNIIDKYDSEYHGVLVHNAEMEMITEN